MSNNNDFQDAKRFRFLLAIMSEGSPEANMMETVCNELDEARQESNLTVEEERVMMVKCLDLAIERCNFEPQGKEPATIRGRENLYLVPATLAVAVPEGETVDTLYDFLNCALIPLQRKEDQINHLIDYTFGNPVLSSINVEEYDYDKGFK